MNFQNYEQRVNIHLFRSSQLLPKISGFSLTLEVAPGIAWTMTYNVAEVNVSLNRKLDEES